MSDDIAKPSTLYPVRVYFWTQDPQVLLTAGFDSLRVERRQHAGKPWKTVSVDPYALALEPTRYNYNWTDLNAERSSEYRAVLQNSVTPGVPADVPQPVIKGVPLDFEMVLTVQELKEKYLWGQDSGFITDDGRTQPDYTFVRDILNGIRTVERKLDIKLMPTKVVERHDWVPESMGKGYLAMVLDEFPLIRVEGLKLEPPGGTPFEYPVDWLRVNKDTGMLTVVPSTVAPLGGRAPRIGGYVPGALEVTYWAGWEPGDIPADLLEVVGLEASQGPLNVAGDLIGGAGLAGTSLSMDGLSQSVTTTNSSTNAGFGARLLFYRRQLQDSYKVLRPYYKGLRSQFA